MLGAHYFTPFDRELSKSTIAVVTAGGVHLRDQEGFNIADELGDLTFREIPLDVDSSHLMATHHHYDHTDAGQDINVVFPIDVLRDLENHRRHCEKVHRLHGLHHAILSEIISA